MKVYFRATGWSPLLAHLRRDLGGEADVRVVREPLEPFAMEFLATRIRLRSALVRPSEPPSWEVRHRSSCVKTAKQFRFLPSRFGDLSMGRFVEG